MTHLTSNYCLYYQAHVERTLCWFLVAVLKSIEHLAFDRTIDTTESLFEFFVPVDNETDFLRFMHYFQTQGVVHNLKKLPNRLLDPSQKI